MASFTQSFEDGWQVESPDEWLFYGNPWEFPQPDDMLEVGFGGHTEYYADEKGQGRVRWLPEAKVLGEPSHTLVPGYGTGTVNMLRLWRARATQEFDFQLFDEGDYARAVEQKVESENITKVLYPNDSTPQGQELRLKQQYFFVTCSLRDIIRRFHLRNSDWSEFPDKVVIQLNDTHPVIAIPELMRLLVDEHRLAWDQAWDITRRTFAYTCHTLLPEALEKWPVDLFGRLLPRHLEIVYEINHHFLEQVRQRFPGDRDRVARMSIIEEVSGAPGAHGPPGQRGQLLDQRRGRTAVQAAAPSGRCAISPTCGRRNSTTRPTASPHAASCGWPTPGCPTLITATIGEGWLTDLDQLRELEPYVDDKAFCAAWREVKRDNKADLAAYILEQDGHRGERRFHVRRDGQAAARVQAPVAQGAAHHHAL